MKVTEPETPLASEPTRNTDRSTEQHHSALAPGLQRLIDRGTLTSVQAAEVTAFDEEVTRLILAGEMTPAQVGALARMLGLRYTEQSGRRSLQ